MNAAVSIPVPDVCSAKGHTWARSSNGVSTGPKRCRVCGERG